MTRRVLVNDKMQKGYAYDRTDLVGRNFAPGFEPQLTPKEMLELGVFGGKYLTDCREEFPSSWFASAKTDERRPAADSTVAGDRAARRGHPEALHQGRRGLSPAATSGGAALGV